MNQVSILIFIVCCLLSGRVGALTMDDIEAKYGDLAGFDAKIRQVKENPLFIKPVESTVELQVRSGEIRWRTIDPIQSEVLLDHSGLQVTIGGQPRQFPKGLGDEKLKALLGFIRSLLSAKLQELKEHFELKLEGHRLTAVPREGGDLSFIKGLNLTFNDVGELKIMRIEVGSEVTTLHFETFKFQSRSQASSP